MLIGSPTRGNVTSRIYNRIVIARSSFRREYFLPDYNSDFQFCLSSIHPPKCTLL